MFKRISKILSASLLALTIVAPTSTLFDSGINNSFKSGNVLNAEAYYQAGPKGVVDGTLFKGNLVEFNISGSSGNIIVKVYVNHCYITTLYHVNSFTMYDPYIC